MYHLLKSFGSAVMVVGGGLTGSWLGRNLGSASIHLGTSELLAILGAACVALTLVNSRNALRHCEQRMHHQALKLTAEQRMNGYSSRIAQKRAR